MEIYHKNTLLKSVHLPVLLLSRHMLNFHCYMQKVKFEHYTNFNYLYLSQNTAKAKCSMTEEGLSFFSMSSETEESLLMSEPEYPGLS